MSLERPDEARPSGDARQPEEVKPTGDVKLSGGVEASSDAVASADEDTPNRGRITAFVILFPTLRPQ